MPPRPVVEPTTSYVQQLKRKRSGGNGQLSLFD